MLDKLAIIDVETTGLSPVRDRIIEIGILRVEHGKVVDTFESLINPGCYLPPEITLLTGIHARELDDAPTFYSIKDDIEDFLGDAMFVAHNARFDYSFIRSEFARCEKTFTSKILDTAKLSRALFPRYRRHNLDSIIERFGLVCDARHRALGDAKVLWEFIRKISDSVQEQKLEKILDTVTKNVSLPATISEDTIRKLPESPGVYIFYNQSGAPIYIGKSVNLRDRILSHFASATSMTKEAKIFRSIGSLEVFRTDGELGALLTESKLIKQYKPMYNRQLREVEQFTVLFRDQNDQGYYTVRMKEIHTLRPGEVNGILAIFKTSAQAKKHLQDLSVEHELCRKLLTIEKVKGACFGSQLHTCRGACTGKELPAKYNLRFIEAFRKTKVKQWPFAGPIAVREGDTYHVISHWCYMGKLTGDSYISEDSENGEYSFDYDTYKILARHLLKSSSQRHIRLLSAS